MESLNAPKKSIFGYVDCMYKIKQLADVHFGRDNVQFTSAYPQGKDSGNIVTPLITYKLKTKEPGKFGGQKEIKPRPRGEAFKIQAFNKTTNAVEDVTITLEGQTFDYHVLFEIWDEDPERADKTLEEFEFFLKQYTGYLQQCGIQELIFEEAHGETENGKWDTSLNCRSVQYLLRIDTVLGAKTNVVNEVHFLLKIYHNPIEYYMMLANEDYYTVDPPHIPIITMT